MMEKLPQEIAFEIFYRLPLDSVVRCKFVCKSWRNLLPRGDDGNYFANMHLRRRRHHQQQRNPDYYSTLNCIALGKFRDDQREEGSVVVEFHITEYDEVGGLNSKVKRLVFTQICISGYWLISGMTELVGSCNGLLCLTITFYGSETSSLKDRIVICNPLLLEYVTLPLSDRQCTNGMVITGFGHNPSTDEYKVVRVYYSHSLDDIGDVEVYTLGNKSASNGAGLWRSKGTIRFSLQRWPPNVFINGSIHWLDDIGMEQNIVSFDLRDEEFRVMPFPSNLNLDYSMYLGELRGCLCLIGETMVILPLDDLDRNLDIWVLNKDDMNNEESWVKEFSIKWVKKFGQWLSPVAIKKKEKDGDGDGDGDEILCWCNRKSTRRLVSYDMKTQSFEKVGERLSMFDGQPFVYSLVSLKALGEDAKYAENHLAKTKT